MRAAPILVIVCLVACAQEPEPSPQAAPSLHPVDLPKLSLTLENGAKLEIGTEQFTIRTVEIASLALPSGQVVATDPITSPNRQPLNVQVDPGVYPVTLALGTNPFRAYDVPLAAILRFGQARPSAWYMATTASQDATALEEGEVYGYAVDSGTGAFLSPESARILARRLFILGVPNVPYIMSLGREAEENADDGMWANVVVDEDSGLNAILFGFGDGFYVSHWGYDTEGSPVCLLTETGLLSQE